MNVSVTNNPITAFSSVTNQTKEAPPLIHTASAPSNDSAKKTPNPVTDIKSAISSLNNFAKSLNTSVTFNMDHSSGKVMIKIIDANSSQLIRQIPSEEALAAVQTIDNSPSNKTTGVLIHSIA